MHTPRQFEYASGGDLRDDPRSLSILSDRSAWQEQTAADLNGAGFMTICCGTVGHIVGGQPALTGDVVLLDCLQVDASLMAAFSDLDMRFAASATQLVISTSLDALDDVFACFDQSKPQILVDPGRADLILAVGRAMARSATSSLKELSNEDRAALLQLTEQVEAISRRLEGITQGFEHPNREAFGVKDAQPIFRGFASSEQEPLVTPRLPDALLVRSIIRQRQARGRYFDPALFADPAWDMLLDLTASELKNKRVSVTSLCIASGVPPTTALRWIGQMTEAGWLKRVEDTRDRRRVFISLTSKAREAMARYFSEVQQLASPELDVQPL